MVQAHLFFDLDVFVHQKYQLLINFYKHMTPAGVGFEQIINLYFAP
jgi:hypothetical protein